MTDTGGTPPPVGSVGEEAVKLLQALQEWAKESGQEYGDSVGAAAAGAGGLLQSVNEHIATGGQDCTYCPVCRMISAVRATSPEVKQHLDHRGVVPAPGRGRIHGDPRPRRVADAFGGRGGAHRPVRRRRVGGRLMGLTIGVDVGGTKVAAGVVDEDGTILKRARRESPATDTEAIQETIADLVSELASGLDVEGVGVGAAGFVDVSRSTVLFAPNLAWRDEPLKAELERRTGLPVVIENDANAAAWGEFAFGAGADARGPAARHGGHRSRRRDRAGRAGCTAARSASPRRSATCALSRTGGRVRAGTAAAGSSTRAAPRWSHDARLPRRRTPSAAALLDRAGGDVRRSPVR